MYKSTFTALMATALIGVFSLIVAEPAAAAKHRSHGKTYRSIAVKSSRSSSNSHARNYYYHGTGGFALRDRASAKFGSPVRGKEFFQDVGSGY